MADGLRIFAVVQCRMSSARLPGKVLRPLCGVPMVGHLLDRLRWAEGLDGIVLATSDRCSDDPVARYAEGLGVAVFRGALDDVAARFHGAALAFGADAVVRVNGDSPLLDPRLVSRAVALFRAEPVDLVTNVLPRSFPKGQSVEVIATRALGRLLASTDDPEDREHVTRYAYRNPAAFRIASFRSLSPRPDMQLSVDTPEDFDRAERILARVGAASPPPAVEEIVALAEALAP